MTNGKLARWLHLGHRWLGIALGLMVLLWFISGLVMLFVARPQLDEAERLAGLPVLDSASLRLSPSAAWQVLGLPGQPQAVRLNAAGGLATYRILAAQRWWAVDAGTGQIRDMADAEQARRMAQAYGRNAKITASVAIDVDQWTVYRQNDPLRPFWRVEFDDGRDFYVSRRSGEVTLDTTRSERIWNWLGSVVHWIYIPPLRQNTPLWRHIVLWSSFAALLLAISGIWLGWQRLRLRKRYRDGFSTPYRDPWKRWHHLLGLIAGGFVATWLFSGWLSLAPWGLAEGPSKAPLPNRLDTDLPDSLPELLPETREVAWVRSGDAIAVIEKNLAGTTISLPARPRQPMLDLSDIAASVQKAFATPILRTVWQERPDSRYFSTRHLTREFPVAQVHLDDASGTVLYVSPTTGRILLLSNRHDFPHRWLYQGLHRFDFPILLEYPWHRDLLIIVLSLAGIGFCLTGCTLAWQRLARPIRRKSQAMRADCRNGLGAD